MVLQARVGQEQDHPVPAKGPPGTNLLAAMLLLYATPYAVCYAVSYAICYAIPYAICSAYLRACCSDLTLPRSTDVGYVCMRPVSTVVV
eukprot:1719375-Rhodomonas_salina.2